MEENNEWIVVTKKSRNVYKQTNLSKKPKQVHQVSSIPLNKQKSKAYQASLLTSNLYTKTLSLLTSQISSTFLQSPPTVVLDINILGIGNFVDNEKPYIQYLLIKSLVNNVSYKFRERQLVVRINTYDPVFTEECKGELRGWFEGVTFEEFDRREGKGKEENGEREELRVYYMIHCEKELYQKVLEFQVGKKKQEGGNRGNSRFIVIGNSLREYNQRLSLIGKPIVKIFDSAQMSETKLDDFEQAFNDTYFLCSP